MCSNYANYKLCPRFYKKIINNSCETHLFYQHDLKNCSVISNSMITLFEPINMGWLYSTTNNISINLNCNNNISNNIILSHNGMIQTTKPCDIIYQNNTIKYPYNRIKDEFPNFVSHLNIDPLENTFLSEYNNTKVQDTIVSLYDQINELSISENAEPINIHDFHHYSLLYVIVVIVILIGIKYHKTKKMEKIVRVLYSNQTSQIENAVDHSRYFPNIN